jgi:hypothetical protein
VSRGDLPNASAPAATITGTTVHYTWTDNSGSGSALATDEAVLVVHCPALNLTILIRQQRKETQQPQHLMLQTLQVKLYKHGLHFYQQTVNRHPIVSLQAS